MDLNRPSSPVLYLSIFIIAICGIIYELIIGTVSSYLWGDSIFYFSVTIGLYMSAMGLGAFFSKYIQSDLFDWFVFSEILIGIFGGGAALFLFWTYAESELYEYWMVGVTIVIGMLVGLEIPWLIRIMESESELKKNVAHVLTFDYIGGLVGAMVFPLVLLPQLGLIKASLVLGMSNIFVAFLNFIRHRQLLNYFYPLVCVSVISLGGLGYFYVTSEAQEHMIEGALYRDKVIFTQQTPYQKLTVTQWHKDLRLFINGGLQFSSLDEYRYHESLVHVPMSVFPEAQNILILGGGDGLAVRELLKYKDRKITLVDLDPAMTQMSKTLPALKQLNQGSLDAPNVTVVNQDAYKFIEETEQIFDIVLIDLPDPNFTGLSKLYSKEFYSHVMRHLHKRGAVVTQSTSPFFAKEAYWCIHKTLKETGAFVFPYQVDVPSFGNWGFQLATHYPIEPQKLKLPLSQGKIQFLNDATLHSLFIIPEDLKYPLENLDINRIIQPVILKYYAKGWNGIR